MASTSPIAGFDVGQTVVLNGVGKAGPDAPPEYRSAEAQARAGRKGVWAQR